MIADSPELLTAAWLSDALDAPVSAVAASPVGTGQMCDSLRLALTFERPVSVDVPSSLIAKLPAADPTSRATGLSLRNYEREVRFYQELAPDAADPHAACVLRRRGRRHGQLRPLARGHEPGRPGRPAAGARRCSRRRWRSTSSSSCTRRGGAIRPSPTSSGCTVTRRRHAPSWRRCCRCCGPASSTAIATDWATTSARSAARCSDRWPRTWETASQPLTIAHGDYRLDNLLFGTEAGGVPIAVVDGRPSRTARRLADVAYFIGAGLLAEVRRAVERDLVHRSATPSSRRARRHDFGSAGKATGTGPGSSSLGACARQTGGRVSWNASHARRPDLDAGLL